MQLQPVLDKFIAIWNNGLSLIVLFVVFNFAVAVAAALKTRVFDLSKIAGFLTDKILPYTIAFIVAQLAGEALSLSALAPTAWAAIMAALLGDLADSLVALGLPLPPSVKALVVKAKEPR